jgi:hypothetical protein
MCMISVHLSPGPLLLAPAPSEFAVGRKYIKNGESRQTGQDFRRKLYAGWRSPNEGNGALSLDRLTIRSPQLRESLTSTA